MLSAPRRAHTHHAESSQTDMEGRRAVGGGRILIIVSLLFLFGRVCLQGEQDDVALLRILLRCGPVPFLSVPCICPLYLYYLPVPSICPGQLARECTSHAS
jgi:hypothetical protein